MNHVLERILRATSFPMLDGHKPELRWLDRGDIELASSPKTEFRLLALRPLAVDLPYPAVCTRCTWKHSLLPAVKASDCLDAVPVGRTKRTCARPDARVLLSHPVIMASIVKHPVVALNFNARANSLNDSVYRLYSSTLLLLAKSMKHRISATNASQ